MKDDKTNILKSEVFAVIRTIENLNSKYNKGLISDLFYAKSIKNTYSELLEINFKIKEIGYSLSDVLNEMKYMNEYQNAIEILNNIQFQESKYGFSRFSILELPGLALEIASSLITLMDMLKLGIIENLDLIDKSLDELTSLFQRFPGLEKIREKLVFIREEINENKDQLTNNNKYRDHIGDKLYSLYKEFQSILNV
jgi:hypothetical protein